MSNEKQTWTDKWKKPFEDLTDSIGKLEGDTAKTALAQLNGLKDDMVAQLVTWGGENKTKRTELVTANLTISQMETEETNLKKQISEFDTSGLNKQITDLTAEINGFKSKEGDVTKARLNVIALHPKFETVKGLFPKVTVSADKKVTIAEDITPEELTTYGDLIKTYDQVEAFGKIEKKEVLDKNTTPLPKESLKPVHNESELKANQKKIADDLLSE